MAPEINLTMDSNIGRLGALVAMRSQIIDGAACLFVMEQ